MRKGEIKEKILDYVEEAGKPVQALDIAKAKGFVSSTIRISLQRLHKEGLIKKVKKGKYSAK